MGSSIEKNKIRYLILLELASEGSCIKPVVEICPCDVVSHAHEKQNRDVLILQPTVDVTAANVSFAV